MIQLQFVLGRGAGSQAIAWFSSGHFSHVDLVLPDGRLLGARSDNADGIKGVAIRRADYEVWHKRVVFAIPCSDTQEATVHDFARAQIGKPYDHTAILGFVMGRDWRKPDSWFCSELAMASLEAAGIIAPLYLAANKITPVAAALVVSALKGTTWR